MCKHTRAQAGHGLHVKVRGQPPVSVFTHFGWAGFLGCVCFLPPLHASWPQLAPGFWRFSVSAFHLPTEALAYNSMCTKSGLMWVLGVPTQVLMFASRALPAQLLLSTNRGLSKLEAIFILFYWDKFSWWVPRLAGTQYMTQNDLVLPSAETTGEHKCTRASVL